MKTDCRYQLWKSRIKETGFEVLEQILRMKTEVSRPKCVQQTNNATTAIEQHLCYQQQSTSNVSRLKSVYIISSKTRRQKVSVKLASFYK